MSEILFEHDETVEDFYQRIRILKVEDKNYPDGVKYSLVLIQISTGKRLLCYDNHHGKGHHYHKYEREFSYRFIDIWILIDDFMNEVQKIKQRYLK